MIGLIDTHTHLFCEEFDNDRDLAIIRAKEAGVTRLFMPNIDDESIESLLSLCDRNSGCYPLMGLHPTSVDTNWEERLAKVEKVLRSGRTFYGIGEVGLDLYWDKTYANEQKQAFAKQAEWALELNLPLIIHCRNAHNELLDVMSKYKETPLRGIFHSFGGSIDEAKELLSFENFMLGINGIVTFKKSTLPETLKQLPLERIVLETDSPYLAPIPYRGNRNESAYLVSTANKLAEIFDTTIDGIARHTTTNALKVFPNVD